MEDQCRDQRSRPGRPAVLPYQRKITVPGGTDRSRTSAAGRSGTSRPWTAARATNDPPLERPTMPDTATPVRPIGSAPWGSIAQPVSLHYCLRGRFSTRRQHVETQRDDVPAEGQTIAYITAIP